MQLQKNKIVYLEVKFDVFNFNAKIQRKQFLEVTQPLLINKKKQQIHNKVKNKNQVKK